MAISENSISGLSSFSSTIDTSAKPERARFSEPEKIEMHDGAKSYLFSRRGADWWSNGAKMDESSLSSLVSAMRDLNASKFPDSGFTAPVMDLTVTSDSGKRVEKVLISKSGDHYVAKRENEPALYELATSSVTDLQNSAAAVKPAAPAAPAKK